MLNPVILRFPTCQAHSPSQARPRAHRIYPAMRLALGAVGALALLLAALVSFSPNQPLPEIQQTISKLQIQSGAHH